MMIARRKDLQFHDSESALAEAYRIRCANELADALIAAASESAVGTRRWFVLKVKTGKEISTQKAMKSKNICAFVPMRRLRLKRNRYYKTKGKAVPLFDGYMFAKVVEDVRAFAGLDTFVDVEYILEGSDGPLPLPEKNMEEFNKLLRFGILDEGVDLAGTRWVKAGETGMINDGPFAWQKAFVKEWRGRRHDRCLAVILGTNISLEIDIDNIERLD